jgi:hypothetical protein
MNRLVKILFLLFLPFLGIAQDTATIISSSDFDETSDQVFLATSGWKKLKPTELSSAYADKNGRLEGWFRIKIKMSSDLVTCLRPSVSLTQSY